ncbi:hypothetical protein QUB68_29690 [Microcoleus sp. A006_D1]|uniref:hypothetical protein n=1 Tax=Microcoleus sp. A006_D1 TaxID=3055267 RepID=UPI002FD6B372
MEGCDRLITRKNQELQAISGVLTAANQGISDRDAEIEVLESRLAAKPTDQTDAVISRNAKIQELEARNHELRNKLTERRHSDGEKIRDLERSLENCQRVRSDKILKVERLEFELAALRSPAKSENSAPTRTDFEALDAADLLNKLKARRKKSKTDLADVEEILEILTED